MRRSILLSLLVPASSLCLPDGIAESQRVNLTSDGESYPLGIWSPTWSAATLTSAVMEILLNEKQGFRTRLSGGPATLDGFFAMAGCETPTEIADRGCGIPQKTYYHVHLEGWTASYQAIWFQIQDDYPDTAPVNLGTMGYQGRTGQYISEEVIETAYAQEGLVLQFYRAHNVSMFPNVANYFDNINAFNVSSLKFCNETRMMDSKVIEDYVWVTGDWDGVDNTSGKLAGRCFSDHFWFAPSCRANPVSCYPYVNTGPGFEFEHWMQKSAVFNIPIFLLVLRLWSDFETLPTKIKSSFYWWQPDPTFLSLDVRRTVFEPFDFAAYGRGILLTDSESVNVDKYASHDLKALAPEVFELLNAFKIDLKMVNGLMMDQVNTGDTPEVVACRWLKANQDLWKSWLPDPTECFPQFGLYNMATKQFVEHRADATNLTCHACTSGFYSSRLKDDAGVTQVCKPCLPGTAQPSGASLGCEACPAGEYQDLTASTNCKRCDPGKYQDTLGRSECKKCPAATTTLAFGSVSVLECGCERGSINIANESEEVVCKECGQGLFCPFSSSLQALKTGLSPLGEQYQPALERGFYSTVEDPLVVFKCAEDSYCPGGTPETCPGGRVGMVCGECPPGETWVGDRCASCDSSTTVLWWLVGPCFFGACTGAYYATKKRIGAIATAQQTWAVSMGLAINWFQIVAIIGMMTVHWPSSVALRFSTAKLLILDVNDWSFSCFVQGAVSRYMSKVLVFPAAVLWIIGNFFLSRLLPSCLSWLQWRPTKTANTIGHLLQVSFAVMSTVALESMTCYIHPNGSYSLVKYSSVACGHEEQLTMMFGGACLLIFGFAFLATVTYATFALPSWSSRMLHQRVQCFNFLTFRFRLDQWWFGLPVLLRGPLMSLVVTCATDFPEVQVCMNVLILTIYALIQALSRPWKTPLLNWLDLCISILLIQLATVSGVSSSNFTEAYSAWLLLLVACTVGTMWFALGIALLQELLGAEAKDSAILRSFESRSAGLDQKLFALSRLLKEHEMSLDEVLGRMNNHDLSRLETSLDLIFLELPGKVSRSESFHSTHSRWRLQERSVGSRSCDSLQAVDIDRPAPEIREIEGDDPVPVELTRQDIDPPVTVGLDEPELPEDPIRL